MVVADPGFPLGGGANSPGTGAPTYDFCQKFPKNCMKLKEFGPRGAPLAPLRSATEWSTTPLGLAPYPCPLKSLDPPLQTDKQGKIHRKQWGFTKKPEISNVFVMMQVRTGRFVSVYPWSGVSLRTPETPRGRNASSCSVCPRTFTTTSRSGTGGETWTGHWR